VERAHGKNERSGLQGIVELPGRDQVVLGVADIELDEFRLGVVEIGAPVVAKQRRFVMRPELNIGV
jgi:hypothetical protein